MKSTAIFYTGDVFEGMRFSFKELDQMVQRNAEPLRTGFTEGEFDTWFDAKFEGELIIQSPDEDVILHLVRKGEGINISGLWVNSEKDLVVIKEDHWNNRRFAFHTEKSW